MMIMRINYLLISFLVLLCVGCSKEGTGLDVPEPDFVIGPKVEIPLKKEASPAPTCTKAHWTDNGDGTAAFVWDENSDVVTSVKHASAFVEFDNSKFYSHTTVSDIDGIVAKLATVNGVKLPVDEQAEMPVSKDDPLYCFSPVNTSNAAVVNAASGSVSVVAPMPQEFTQERNGETAGLSDYSYIYAEASVLFATREKITASEADFASAVSMLRFCVTNGTTDSFNIKRVSVNSQDKSAVFPDKLVWTAGDGVSEPADKSGYYNSVGVSIGGEGGEALPANTPQCYYVYALPIDGGFTDKKLVFAVETDHYTYNFTLSASKIVNSKFEAGKMYTFNFTLKDKEIHLSTITVSNCTAYGVASETTSQLVVVEVNAWNKDSIHGQNIRFVDLGIRKTVGAVTYKVLWAANNLGSEYSSGSGLYFQWGALRSYLNSTGDTYYSGDEDIQDGARDIVKNYLGSGAYKWCLPSAEDWQTLLDSSTQTYTFVSTGNFEGSIWRFRSTIAGYTDQIIYLPLTGFFYNQESAKTKNSDSRCHYWTSTSVSGGSQAISFGSTDGNTSFGSQSEQRSLGYAVRPILLIEVQ